MWISLQRAVYKNLISSRAFERGLFSGSSFRQENKNDEVNDNKILDEVKDEAINENKKVINEEKKVIGIKEDKVKKEKKESEKKKDAIKFLKMNARTFKMKSLKGVKISKLPKLEFGLERALFNPGVTYLRDPHSGVYNFDPYVEEIMEVDNFDFEKIQGYIPSSEDKKLQDIADKNMKKYIATTSSITHLLCHISFVITNWRSIDTSFLGKEFTKMSQKFSRTLTYPCSVLIKQNSKGIYSINADKSFDKENTILSQLGQLMERMLTMKPKEFKKYKKGLPDNPELNVDSIYNYSLWGKFALRSQLDCNHPWIPKHVFDLKTRAALPIRLDKENYKDYLGYQIKYLNGKLESFEREYYDLMRSAFMKYSYQVRIGNMDGCFVAYHNTKNIFGFQYISLKEMDQRLFGSSILGDQVFGNSLQLLQKVLDRITQEYKNQDFVLTFKSLQDSLILDIYVQIIDKETKEYFIHPQHQIVKYQLICYSTINGNKVLEPINLKDKKEKWELNYHLRKINMDSLDLYNDYVNLRKYQKEYFNSDMQSIPWLMNLRKLVKDEDNSKVKKKVL